jgi:hypothetical protein
MLIPSGASYQEMGDSVPVRLRGKAVSTATCLKFVAGNTLGKFEIRNVRIFVKVHRIDLVRIPRRDPD